MAEENKIHQTNKKFEKEFKTLIWLAVGIGIAVIAAVSYTVITHKWTV